MKKFISVLISVLMVAGIFTSLPISSSAKTTKRVSLKKTSATLKISKKNGKTVYGSTAVKVKKLKGVKLKKITYKSLNKKVAKVSKKGKVTAKKQGKTEITVKVSYTYKNKAYKKSLAFKVKVKDVRVTTVVDTVPVVTESPTEPVTESVEVTKPAYEPTEYVTEPDATQAGTNNGGVENDTEWQVVTHSDIEGDTNHCIVSEPSDVPYSRPDLEGDTHRCIVEPSSVYSEPYSEDETTAPATEPDTKKKSFKEKLTAFSNKLYNMTSENESGNYVMSPVSVYMALSMLYESGDSGVKSDIEALVGMDESDIAKTGELYKSLTKEYKGYDYETGKEYLKSKISLSNSIWYDDNETVNADALKKLSDDLYCEARAASFKNNNTAANKEIREFIKEKTNGLIDKDFDLSAETLFALINTLYFKDVWMSGELMHGERYFSTAEGFKKCEFLYGDYEYGRVQETSKCYYFYTTMSGGNKVKFILPKRGCTLAEAMSADNLNTVNLNKNYDAEKAYDDDITVHMTRCIFPEFNLESNTPLKDIFMDNNVLGNAFTSFCSPLIDGKELDVSDIKHTAVLKVNKDGVEGAAVTIIETEATAMPNKEMYHNFVLDRNFGFMITDPDDVVLFTGQVVDPQPENPVIKQDDLDFSLRFNIWGDSSYDSKTAVLTKSNGYIERTSEEFKALLVLDDDQKNAIKEALNSLDLNSYPDNYTMHDGMSSMPSEVVVLRVGDKTVTCEDYGAAKDEQGKKFLEAVEKIKKVLTSSSAWNSLPEYEVLFD